SALGLRRPLGAAFPRSRILLRLGLDAHPPARQTARRRTAADPVRPLRLGRTVSDHRRDGCRRSVGHARPRGGAGALVRIAGHRRPPAASGRLRGRGGLTGMKRFAELLDRLVLTPSRNGKLRLLTGYFRETEDPDRGLALAAITGDLSLAAVKAAMLRALVTERIDPVLFGYSYDYVGDLAETVSLVWPTPHDGDTTPAHHMTLAEVIAKLQSASRSDGPKVLAGLLDRSDIPARFAII